MPESRQSKTSSINQLQGDVHVVNVGRARTIDWQQALYFFSYSPRLAMQASKAFPARWPLAQMNWPRGTGKTPYGRGTKAKGKGEMDGIRVYSFSSVNIGRKSATRKDRITVFKGQFSCQFLKVGGLFQWCRLDGTIHLANIRSCSMSSAIGNVLVF